MFPFLFLTCAWVCCVKSNKVHSFPHCDNDETSRSIIIGMIIQLHFQLWRSPADCWSWCDLLMKKVFALHSRRLAPTPVTTNMEPIIIIIILLSSVSIRNKGCSPKHCILISSTYIYAFGQSSLWNICLSLNTNTAKPKSL